MLPIASGCATTSERTSNSTTWPFSVLETIRRRSGRSSTCCNRNSANPGLPFNISRPSIDFYASINWVSMRQRSQSDGPSDFSDDLWAHFAAKSSTALLDRRSWSFPDPRCPTIRRTRRAARRSGRREPRGTPDRLKGDRCPRESNARLIIGALVLQGRLRGRCVQS